MGLFSAFKYGSRCDKFMVFCGVLSSIISGLFMPSIALVMGDIVAIFDPNSPVEKVREELWGLLKMIGVLASILWVFGYLQYALM